MNEFTESELNHMRDGVSLRLNLDMSNETRNELLSLLNKLGRMVDGYYKCHVCEHVSYE